MISRQEKKNTKVEGESRRHGRHCHDRRRHGAVAARAVVVVVGDVVGGVDGGVIVMAFVVLLCDTRELRLE
jgi:hypothetical protein